MALVGFLNVHRDGFTFAPYNRDYDDVTDGDDDGWDDEQSHEDESDIQLKSRQRKCTARPLHKYS